MPAETANKHKAGIYVFTPQGDKVGTIPVPADRVTNGAFGGPDLKTLFITAGDKLWSIRVDTPGQLAYPKLR